MSINCLKGTRFEKLIKNDSINNIELATSLNQEYNNILQQLSNLKKEDYTSKEIIPISQVKNFDTREELISKGVKKIISNTVSLGNKYNEDGVLISDILSELLTAYVDIARDPYILDLNAVTEVANTILMMTRQGIGLKKIFYFVNQPIIKEYLRLESNENSISNDTFGTQDKHVTSALRNFGINIPINSMIYFTERQIREGLITEDKRKGKIYSDFTLPELTEGIIGGGKNKEVQLKALDMFLELKAQSTEFQEMIRSTSPDTQGFKSFTMLEKQVELKKEVARKAKFKNYEKMFDGFVGTFWDIKSDYKMNTSQFFLAQLPGYKPQLDELKQMVADVVKNPELEEKQILKIENDFTVFLASANGVIDFRKDFSNLFTGAKSVPKSLVKLQKEYEKQGRPNSFLDIALPLINERKQGYDSVKPKTKKISSLEKENITPDYQEFGDPVYRQYFNELLGLPAGTDFYKDMNKYFYMQTGINNSPYNMVNFMPATDYIGMIRDVITKASDGTMDISAYTELYGPDIGLYVMNNLSLFYRKDRNLSFKVNYHKVSKKFSVSIPMPDGTTLKLWQRGSNNLLDYGKLSVRVNEPTNAGNTTLDENNPLNCPSNKK